MIWFLSAQWRASKESGPQVHRLKDTSMFTLQNRNRLEEEEKKTGQREGLKNDYGNSEGFIKYVKIH